MDLTVKSTPDEDKIGVPDSELVDTSTEMKVEVAPIHRAAVLRALEGGTDNANERSRLDELLYPERIDQLIHDGKITLEEEKVIRLDISAADIKNIRVLPNFTYLTDFRLSGVLKSSPANIIFEILPRLTSVRNLSFDKNVPGCDFGVTAFRVAITRMPHLEKVTCGNMTLTPSTIQVMEPEQKQFRRPGDTGRFA